MILSLAQALRKKAELITEINTLQARIIEGATYMENAEVYSVSDFDAMRNEVASKRGKLLVLKLKIDAGNHQEMNGETVYGLIVERGELKAELEFWCNMRNAVLQAVGKNRYGYDENAPKLMARMTVKQVDEIVDNLRREAKRIDDGISDLNGKIRVEVDL